ncbi:hypothetical protein KY311_03495 [Candidatus Woesearchaeota archaeon]|nr:hypothetical protein [Candidatus Woesearchaeota archaeon]MBW3017167.1 hypothetical protein [Candidatus Woesearchaeota archaeon]
MKSNLLVFLSYALGLILLAGLVIARFPVYTTAWFVLFIVTGVFLSKSMVYDTAFFLVHSLIGLVLFFATGSILLIGVSLLCAYGFFMSAVLPGKIAGAGSQREKIKQIIKEVVEKKEQVPEVKVVDYSKPEAKVEPEQKKAEPAKKAAKPKAKKKKSAKKKK